MSESVLMMVKFALYGIGIFVLVFVIALITPKLAGFIDKQVAKRKNPERVDENNFPDVKGIYDAQPSEKDDTDENNEDNGDVDNGRQ